MSSGIIDDALAVREQLRAQLTGRHDADPGAKRLRVGEYARSWMRRKFTS